MLSFVDELELASNAYRTKGYIVTQRIIFRSNKVDGSMIISIELRNRWQTLYVLSLKVQTRIIKIR